MLMANPPFAGDIKEPRMIARYDLAKKPDGKWQTKVGRDILFIERNLDFLKPGGRMAIVLPQGRFNNSSDKNIRDFIAERCRILAVVGLHGNTFKPHTGTKTSVLFVQKWNDDPKAGALCPRQDDYNIFFATMRKSGKDNSGDKIWRKITSSTSSPAEDELSDLMPPSPVQRVVGVEGDFLQDEHGHLVVDHDLYNHEGLTEDGIAEAFIEFAKKERLSFFESSPSVAPFDAIRYQRLMDGLEAVEIGWKVINCKEKIRIDSEHYQKKYKVLVEKLSSLSVPIQNLESLIKQPVLTGHTPSMAKESYYGGDIKFIKTDNLRENLIQDNFDHFLSNEGNEEIKRSALKENDIIVTIIGATYDIIGRACLIEKEILPANINQNIALIRVDKNKISPFYLNIYLNTFYGRGYLHYLSRQTEQVNLNCREVEELHIPVFSSDFQKRIEGIMLLIKRYRIASNKEYAKAEDLLLAELGLKDWQPTEETVAVKSFAESFLSSGRFDAEYYQPKQQKVMAIMRQSGLCIGDVVSLAKRKFQPEKEGSFNYIEIGNLSGEGFANSEVVAMEEAPSRAQWIVKTNDVITSTVRPIRRLSALIEPEQNNYICSSGFAVLKPTQIEPEVLLVYLRSPIVCEILDLHTTASMYPAISTEDLLNIPITLPEKATRQKIAGKVRESRKAREQSKQLLEIAKTGVERAIETDEATATIWINEQLEALGVELT